MTVEGGIPEGQNPNNKNLLPEHAGALGTVTVAMTAPVTVTMSLLPRDSSGHSGSGSDSSGHSENELAALRQLQALLGDAAAYLDEGLVAFAAAAAAATACVLRLLVPTVQPKKKKGRKKGQCSPGLAACIKERSPVLKGLQQPVLAAQDVDDSLTKNAVEEYSRLEASGKFSVKGSSMASKTLDDFRSKYRHPLLSIVRKALKRKEKKTYASRTSPQASQLCGLQRCIDNIQSCTDVTETTQCSADAVRSVMWASKPIAKQPPPALKCQAVNTAHAKWIRRMADGRLQLRSSKGEWFQCRLDMEVPGSMLLRDPKGNVYAIQTEALQQIDLSDDLVALMMFADGDWEKQMSAMEYIDEKGKVKQLQLDDKDFREVVGLLSGLEDAEEAQTQNGRK
ncbi:hypothetical protein DUNSADRAFT_4660 [Dunaliella salina]|uniref:Uncharacterized protein n=1 Tax=Dunaliella salina TaxID=3046 RepID=A0ABQ7GRH6_DUNSA|nr:hypothetical protein DUNSADRAFT_4660 [Dunaliella salina]|eukprot:KAF5837205.1 hypothetical protein DUNSADRAFT_4660 [Dunaliella salina]